jgi:hypothetical protein
MARGRIELPARGFSVLCWWRDYVTLSVAIGIRESGLVVVRVCEKVRGENVAQAHCTRWPL